jgi:hypothetical protein
LYGQARPGVQLERASLTIAYLLFWYRKSQMKPELHGSYLKKSKRTFVSAKKVRIKILGVVNVELHQSANSHFKIACILGNIKIINLAIYLLYVHYAQIYTFVIFVELKI